MDTKDKVRTSARLKRFLQASMKTISSVQFNTPGQYFHVLRRQIERLQKATHHHGPEVALRDKRAVSEWTDFESGSFQQIIDDS